MASSSQTARRNRFSGSSCHRIYGLEKNLISMMDNWHYPGCRGVCNCVDKTSKTPIRTMDCRKRKPQNSDHEFEMHMGTRVLRTSRCCLKRYKKCYGFNNYVLLLERPNTKSWLIVYEAADIPYDLGVRGPDGILELNRCQRLKMLNFLCDEALYVW
ncbi:hypothetical protein ACFE04_027034 [Oxalis oulophora]